MVQSIGYPVLRYNGQSEYDGVESTCTEIHPGPIDDSFWDDMLD